MHGTESRSDLTKIWEGLKSLMVCLVMISLGVSQAVTGWIGDPLWMRLIYPLILVPFGLLIGWQGYLGLMKEFFGMSKAINDPSKEPTDSLPGE
ncbi:MAG: hypothetical protein WDZ51_14615 [Pirellulaceae bacterium]